jgi:hypothetical protein
MSSSILSMIRRRYVITPALPALLLITIIGYGCSSGDADETYMTVSAVEQPFTMTLEMEENSKPKSLVP